MRFGCDGARSRAGHMMLIVFVGGKRLVQTDIMVILYRSTILGVVYIKHLFNFIIAEILINFRSTYC